MVTGWTEDSDGFAIRRRTGALILEEYRLPGYPQRYYIL
jgi:hypothetical protein